MKTSKIYRICAVVAHFFALVCLLFTVATTIFMPSNPDATVMGVIATVVLIGLGTAFHVCATDNEKDGR